jgi:cytoskeletal protein CcmA (bactofilin family)
MAIEYYSSIDLNQNELQHPRLQHSGSNPTSPSPVSGQLYYNSGDNTVRFYDGSSWQTLSTTTGDITGVTAGTGLSGGGTSGGVTLNLDATHTAITSITNASLVVGRDADNQIKFSTDDQIIFRVGGGDGVTFKASGEIEATSLDISGDADVDGTLEADAYTVNGTALDEFIQDTVGAMFSSNTETRISVTYQDGDGTIDLVVDDMTANDNDDVSVANLKTRLAGGFGSNAVTIGDSNDVVTIGNDLIVTGDLTVSGDTISANVSTLDVEDKNITLNKGSGDTSSTADGAGITIQDAVNSDTDATLLWNASNDKFVFSHLIEAPGTSIFTNLDISGDVDVDGTLETDALTIGGSAVLAQATTSAVGAVELATSAETQTGTDTARAVTPDGLAARHVVADIDVSSLTDSNIVTITHNLGTADVMVQVYDATTEANIMCDIARTTDDFSTASTSVISIDFGTAPPNDCRVLITSLKGATASGTVAYT